MMPLFAICNHPGWWQLQPRRLRFLLRVQLSVLAQLTGALNHSQIAVVGC